METLINNKTKLKLLFGFGFGFLLIVLVQYISSRSVNEIIKDERELLITTKIIEQTEGLKAHVSAFESKMRGFIITGNEKFLEGNEASELKSFDNVEELMASEEGNINKHYREQLAHLINKKISFNRSILIAYDKVDNSAAVALIKTGRGKELMDSIVDVCDDIITKQKLGLDKHKRQNEFNSALVLNADLISGVIILITIIIALVILFKDINDRIRLENTLREEQRKVEKSMLIKEQFMANMSHEIRTPLNAMLGFSGLLERTNLSDQQRDYLQAIDSAGKNLMTIINDILDFSKIEAGMLGIEKVPFSLPQLLQSAYTMFFPKAQSKNLKLYLSIDPNLPQLVIGDPTRLNQILMNLIGNAVKFTTEGVINVDCDIVELKNDKVKIKISVEDTGIGIAQSKIDAIFDRFTQADSATTRNFGGTGLGLSIAKKLAEMQGGEIDVKSVIDDGSIFSLIITYEIADDKEYNHDSNQSKITNFGKSKKALIVEDNILNQKLAVMLLQEEGFETNTAINGDLAITELKNNHYDVILMDIQMPVMDGYETTKKIRNELKITTPIIAMTANAMAGEYEKCISSGMNEYITKPFKADTLYNALKKIFNKENTAKKSPDQFMI